MSLSQPGLFTVLCKKHIYIYIFLWDPLVFWLVPTKFCCVAWRKHTVGKARRQSFAGDRHTRPGPPDPRADSSRAVHSLNRSLTCLPCFRLLYFSLSCVYSSVFLTNLHIFESSSKLCGFLRLFLIFFEIGFFFSIQFTAAKKKKSRNNDGFSLAFLGSPRTLS